MSLRDFVDLDDDDTFLPTAKPAAASKPATAKAPAPVRPALAADAATPQHR